MRLAFSLSAIAAVLFSIATAAEAAVVTVNVDGVQRTALVQGTTTSGPHPVVLMLHGGGGNAAGMAKSTQLGAAGVRDDFVAVFPQGINNFWDDGRPKVTNQDQKKGIKPPDDIAFIKALVAQLIATGVADPKRVYMAGFSNGGFLTLDIGCEDASMFAAVAVIEANVTIPSAPSCHSTVPVPFLEMSGTADPKVQYGGRAAAGPGVSGLWSTMQTVDFFRTLDGCSSQSSAEHLAGPTGGPTGTDVTRWTTCSKAAPVVLYKIIGGVHAIPKAPFAANQLWAFFKDLSRT